MQAALVSYPNKLQWQQPFQGSSREVPGFVVEIQRSNNDSVSNAQPG